MILAKGVQKNLQGRAVLKGIDLTVARGEFLSVMGKSGSGKSTLLGVLSGNLRADGGSVLLDGEDVCQMTDARLAELRRTKLGFVYQSLNLISTLDARDNILLPVVLSGKSIKAYEGDVRELAEELEISDVLKRFPYEMSGGQRQRVAIARALLHSPSVMMLDEPTGSLDSGNTERVMELLDRIHRERGVTMIQVTHSKEAAAYGDRTVVISDGEVVG